MTRRLDRGHAMRVAGAFAVVAIAAAGGFIAGRVTAPEPTAAADSVCADAMDSFLAHTEGGDGEDELRLGALVVEQNPECFHVDTRVKARDFLRDRNKMELSHYSGLAGVDPPW